jgi:prevent-host-death family protein
MEISAKELRESSGKIIEQAARGTEIVITLRGKKMAKLVPYSLDHGKNSDEDEIFGIWKNHTGTADVDGYVRSIRKGRKF